MKKVLTIVLLILVVTSISVIVTWTNGFTDFEIKELNPDNLFNASMYSDALANKRSDGLKVDVDDDGVITIDGENKTDDDVMIVVGQLTLAKGEYTISSSARGTGTKTYYMQIHYGTGETETVIIADDGEDSTFELEEETECIVEIIVCAGEEIDTTFKPVIVSGDKAGRFYIIG